MKEKEENKKFINDIVNQSKKEVNQSLGVGVVLAITFTYWNIFISNEAWNKLGDWEKNMWFNVLIVALGFLWIGTILYFLRLRNKFKQTTDEGSLA